MDNLVCITEEILVIKYGLAVRNDYLFSTILLSSSTFISRSSLFFLFFKFYFKKKILKVYYVRKFYVKEMNVNDRISSEWT